jgi:serine/threonine protein kinase/tetratricopeptide (TPR) repeat protein
MSSEQPLIIEAQSKSYKVIKTLGSGGTSIVYLANDGKREVALKILGEDVDPAFKDRYIQILKNEFEVLSKLRHPNIAEVYDFEYAPKLGKYFFTTEFINGSDIYNYTNTADFNLKEDLFVQLLLALDYVHRCGVVHCDIKCGNALVTQIKKTSVVKLVDFGFATRKLASTGMVVGTPHYLAPELLVGGKEIDHKIDIYAAGIVYYRLLHRAYPCVSSEVNDIIKWHREHSPVCYSESLPDYTRHLISRMIETYPPDRIASCAKAIEFINFRTEGKYKKLTEKIVGLQFKEGPLVGRSDILEEISGLFTLLKTQKSPKQYGYIFTGPQGIGKSRLLREIKYRAELEEIPFREVVCVDGKDNVAEFMDKFREIEKPKESKTSESNENKLSHIQWINALIGKFKTGGLVVVIDDVQASGSAFTGFLKLFEERVRVNRTDGNLPLVIFITSRPKTELDDITGRWFDQTKIPKRDLATLKEYEVKDYMEKIGAAQFKDTLPQAVSFSGGIPGLLEAYCQHIWTFGKAAKPPENLAQSYIDRIKLLPQPVVKCVDFLSVARRGLVLDDLVTLTGQKRESVLEHIQKLVTIGFATIAYPSMAVNLSNKAIGQTVKSNLDKKIFADVSIKLGSWLEKVDSSAVAEIADYYGEAEEPAKASIFAEAAAKQFEDQFNLSEASKYFNLALKFSANDEKKKSLTRAIARAEIMTGKYKEAISKLEGLLKGGDETLENYRILGMAYSKMRDFAHAKSWYEEGLKKMTDETAITDIVRFKNSLGNVSFYTGDLENSEKYFTEAIADATECLLLNNNLGLILSAKGNYEQAIRFYDGRKRFLSAKKNKGALALCHADCGYINMTHNRVCDAIAEFEQSYKLALEMGDLYNILVVLGNLVRCHQRVADFTKALDYALKGLEVEASIGSVDEIAQNHLTIGILYEAVGVLDLAKKHIGMAKDRFIALNNMAMVGWCHLTMSYIWKDLDKKDDANKEMEKALKIATELKIEDLLAWVQLSKAELCIEYGGLKEAGEIIDTISDIKLKEFELRKKLLKLKLEAAPENVIKEEFRKHIDDCSEYPELKWEAIAAAGYYLEKVGHPEEALFLFKQSFEMIESIALRLAEAYRDSYKSQRFRLKIVQKFQPDFNAKPAAQISPDASIIDGKTSEIK